MIKHPNNLDGLDSFLLLLFPPKYSFKCLVWSKQYHRVIILYGVGHLCDPLLLHVQTYCLFLFIIMLTSWHLSGEQGMGRGGVIMVYSTSYFAETRGDNKEIKVIFFDYLCYYNYILQTRREVVQEWLKKLSFLQSFCKGNYHVHVKCDETNCQFIHA